MCNLFVVTYWIPLQQENTYTKRCFLTLHSVSGCLGGCETSGTPNIVIYYTGTEGDEENICNSMVGPTLKWCKPIVWEYILTLQGDLVSLGKSSQQVRENCDKSARELLNLKMASERKNKNFCPFMASCFPIWTAPSLNCSTRGWFPEAEVVNLEGLPVSCNLVAWMPKLLQVKFATWKLYRRP